MDISQLGNTSTAQSLLQEAPSTQTTPLQNSLGKDDFLQLLISQLQNQDPTAPMEDKEFISQMAQFSSLEQVTNMSKGFADMAVATQRTEALQLLGKRVQIAEEDGSTISGKVLEVYPGDSSQIRVNNTFYDTKQIIQVSLEEASR